MKLPPLGKAKATKFAEVEGVKPDPDRLTAHPKSAEILARVGEKYAEALRRLADK